MRIIVKNDFSIGDNIFIYVSNQEKTAAKMAPNNFNRWPNIFEGVVETKIYADNIRVRGKAYANELIEVNTVQDRVFKTFEEAMLWVQEDTKENSTKETEYNAENISKMVEDVVGAFNKALGKMAEERNMDLSVLFKNMKC